MASRIASSARLCVCVCAGALLSYGLPLSHAKDAVYQRSVGYVGALADAAFTAIALGEPVSVSPMYKICTDVQEYSRTAHEAVKFKNTSEFQDIPCRWQREIIIDKNYIAVTIDHIDQFKGFSCEKFTEIVSTKFKTIRSLEKIYVVGFSENVSLWGGEKLRQVERDLARYFYMSLAEISCSERNIVLRIKRRG